jgi:hypothetical protein
VGYGLSVARQNRWEDEDGAGHASGSSGLLSLKASRVRVSQSGLKTDRGATWMVHVASPWRLHGDQAEDKWADSMGCIELFYPNFTVIVVLVHKGNLAISFPINRTPRAGGEVSASSIPPPHLGLDLAF